ncbi:hypothetical protein HPB47_027359 [Ixodes persulcatus]|uniref:Uncharacterized protein n=1 Tax=Ixodes persulcatus TaxID=34615 RepID=A0AC60PW23_IXOPE|nr:hypothetical protein HPB47_027359 [Ixodes persulcatus]
MGIKRAWYRPRAVMMILRPAIGSTTVECSPRPGLAALADAMMEVTTPSVASVTVAPQHPTTRDSGSAANSQPPQANIEQLCQCLEEILVPASKGRAHHPPVTDELDDILSRPPTDAAYDHLDASSSSGRQLWSARASSSCSQPWSLATVSHLNFVTSSSTLALVASLYALKIFFLQLQGIRVAERCPKSPGST